MRKILFLSIGILISSLLFAGEIYVNPGDNLQNAVNNASGGDVIIINGGTYGPLSITNRRFTQSDPLIIKKGSAVPTIRNSSISSGRAVYLSNVAYIAFDGLKLEGGMWGFHAFDADHIILVNSEITGQGQEGIQARNGCQYLDIINVTIHDIGLYNPQWGEGIYLGGDQGGNEYLRVENCTIYECGYGEAINIKSGGCKYVTVTGNNIHDIHPGTSSQWNAGAIACDHGNGSEDKLIWIQNNIIDGVYGGATSNTGIMVQQVGARVINNTVKNCSDYGIWFNAYQSSAACWNFGNTYSGNGQDVRVSPGATVYNSDPGLSPYSAQTWYDSGSGSNAAPVANAGADQTVEDSDDSGGELITLNGSASYDSDGSIVSYSWEEGGSQIAAGVSPSVDLAVGTHTITLIVTDDEGATGNDDVVITINAAGSSYNVALNKPVTATAEQVGNEAEGAVDGSTLEEDRWSAEGFPQSLEIDLQQNYDIDRIDVYPLADRAYQYTVEARPDGGSYSTIVDRSSNTTGGNVISDSFNPVTARFVKITVTGASGYTGSWVSFREVEVYGVESGTPVNQAPVASAGPDQTVEDSDDSGSETVTLDGSGSSDTDGSIVSYSWEEDGTQIATGVSPSVDLAVGSHAITLIVTDNDGATASDDVVVTVNAPSNTSPISNAGTDQTLEDSDDSGSETVTLDGSGSSDADGSIVSYSWEEGGNQIATGISPSVDLSVGTHNITLIVTDDDGATGSDDVVITVNAGSGGGTVENVALNKPVTASAWQDDTYGYQPPEEAVDGDVTDESRWSANGFPQWLEIDLGQNYDIEQIDVYPYQDRAYQYIVEAMPEGGSYSTIVDRSANTGGGNVISDSFTPQTARFVKLTVSGASGYTGSWVAINEAQVYGVETGTPVNQGPVSNAGTDQTVEDSDDSGSETVTLDGSGSSDADGSIVSYSWEEGGSQIATGVSPSVDLSVGSHIITLIVTDDDGATGIDDVVVTVNAPSNTSPIANAGPDQTLEDSDDSGSETVTLDGSGSSDADGPIVSYSWEEGGNQIATGVTPAIDLTVGTHNITLIVTDDDGATGSDEVVITVEAYSGGGTYENVALNKPVIATAEQTGNEAEGAVDGSTLDDDRWSADGFPQSIEIDLQQNYDIDKVDVHPLSDRAYQYIVEVKVDGGSYSTIVDRSSNTTGANVISDSFIPTTVQFVKLTVSGVSGYTGTWVSLREVEVFGIESGTPVNQAPVASAGSDQTIEDSDDSGSETVTLDGSGSSDADGSIVSYSWEECGIQIATGISPSMDLSVGTHNITLIVTDDDGATGTDDVVVTVNAASGGTFTLNPVHDAYVRDNSTQDGTGSTLITKNGYTGWKREAYVMFDLSPTGLASASDATLRLYCNRYDGGNSELYQVGDDNWTETGITWNNKPASGTLISSQSGSTGYMEWDVTSFVSNELAGDDVVSFRLVATDDAFIDFNSKEASSNHPELVINDPLKSGKLENVSITSLDEKHINEFAAYPNPFSQGQLTVYLNGCNGCELRIINALGRLIYSKDLSGEEVHLINRSVFDAAGVYTIFVQTQGKVLTKRVVIR